MVWAPHVTVAAVAEYENQYLMVEEMVAGYRVFNQPAGHLEPGESLLEAVMRETLEETARQFTPQALIGVYRLLHPIREETYLRFTFSGTVATPEPGRELDTEILRSLWMSRPELDQTAPERLRSDIVIRCLDDYLAGQCYPLGLLHDLV